MEAIRRGAGRAGEAIVLGLACLAPWAFGAVDAWAELALDLGIALSTPLALLASRCSERSRCLACLPSVALGGLALLATAQSAPLPEGLLARLDPAWATQRAELLPGGEGRVAGDAGRGSRDRPRR